MFGSASQPLIAQQASHPRCGQDNVTVPPIPCIVGTIASNSNKPDGEGLVLWSAAPQT